MKPQFLGEAVNGTVREAYVEASSFLEACEVQDARIVCELLLQHVLGVSRSEMLFMWSEKFPAARATSWREGIQRKAEGEPVQYIIGETDFYGITLGVGPGVLIPRPETELLVEHMMHEAVRLFGQGAELTLADVGTGSGAIPVTIARHCPAWRVYASDLSPQALEIARKNAARCGVHEQITFFEGDLLRPFIEGRIAVDVLVSNPPYIPAREIPSLQPEVRLFEPHLALVGGEDGLEPYRRLCEQLPELPKMPTLVGFEVGMGQAEDVAALLRACGNYEVHFVKDLAGIDRHVIGVQI
ncbi:peptide chain release factor N(5)-glutamine methyltransferase [Paenibacillus sp. N1-5-1-14]|uniref:peptide chain release factor N(5)-glutamine methyltransferase n=1 Tax=Paenibacillus radicibacter TaxID=2972488 RepID=UPI002158C15A|nr:peptide chain release factor N(5)-glutamine methyltransferase [Paenibacillus radicibacter]MCR8645115.1 peptide chain release factor N(5)-glutamine methyltransferase [Paenibacillus radicibacter]